MTDASAPNRAADAALAAVMLAVDPVGLGGVVLRCLPGPPRDAFLALLRNCLTAGAPMRRMPIGISEGRLLGGLDIAATLRAGKPIAERGLLAEANGGVVILAMAERLQASIAAQICAVVDTSEVITARDGVASRSPARLGFVALDEGLDDDEALPAPLRDRLAFFTDLAAGLDADDLPYDTDAVQAARDLLPDVTIPDTALQALCTTALALGVFSLRGSVLAVRAARVAAALAGRGVVAMEDAALAARLVLAPRATTVPPAGDASSEPETADDQASDQPPDEPGASPEDAPDAEDTPADGDQPMGDIVLEAARAAIPAGLLAQLQAAEAGRSRPRASGKAGALQKSGKRGRPAGLRRAAPSPNARLNLVETLRAAAPWQRLRQSEASDRIQVRIEDFHVTRYRQRSETTTIFAVDASGSSASNRLAEAKGAVELLLADCYVRRDSVAVLAFRGKTSELLLPPTRSLVRAKRSLSALPGGGGTPLAAGIDAAEALAASVQRRGGTPVIVLLTDGRANVGRDGLGGRARAEQEALEAATRLKLSGRTVLLVDTSPRPAPLAQALATAMSARYLPLPYADAALLSRAVQAVAPPSR